MKKYLFIFIFIFAACSAKETPEQPARSGGADTPLAVEAAPHTPTPVPNAPPADDFIDFTEIPPPQASPAHPRFYESLIDEQIAQMTIEEKIGQLFMLRLPWQTLYVNDAVHALFEEVPMGGVIIFSDNAATAEQVQSLTSQLQSVSRIPLFIATDEEGGRVSRVGRLFAEGVAPSAFEIGDSTYPDSQAFETGLAIGQGLTMLGINMNFAPVADIWSNPRNTVIGNRAFGREADVVAPLVESSVNGFRESGIMSFLKHFPGHGNTDEDSHITLALNRNNFENWRNTEALPFISGMEAGVSGVMVGHIATPEINNHIALFDWMQPWIDSGHLPATFSSFWLNDILRGEFNFDGLIITDALDMSAMTENFTDGQIALGAFLAGADILLMPANPAEAYNALLTAYNDGLFNDERLNQSLRRILSAKGF